MVTGGYRFICKASQKENLSGLYIKQTEDTVEERFWTETHWI